MEIPLRFRQVALTPTAIVFVLLSFPLSIVVHDVVAGIVDDFTGTEFTWLTNMAATIAGMGSWMLQIYLIFKFVATGGFHLLD